MGIKLIDQARLPKEWIRAYERDSQGQPDYAGPAWERKAARALSAFILSGIFFLALPGAFLGVWAVDEFRVTSKNASPFAASPAMNRAIVAFDAVEAVVLAGIGNPDILYLIHAGWIM